MLDIYKHLRYFNRSEFSNPDAMATELLLKLDWARHKSNLPFILTSTYRANDARTHGRGLAVDISCKDSKSRLIMLDALRAVEFTRIGLYPAHIHVDIAISEPEAVWLGTYPKGVTNGL